jgi:hypothetical protein
MRENCGVSGGGYSRESPAASASVSSRSGSKQERRKASNQASTVRAHNQAVSHLLPIFPPRPLNNLSLRLAEYSKSFAPHVHQAVGVLRNATPIARGASDLQALASRAACGDFLFWTKSRRECAVRRQLDIHKRHRYGSDRRSGSERKRRD